MSCSPPPNFPALVTDIEIIRGGDDKLRCLYTTGSRTWVDYCGKYNVGDTVSTFKVH